MQQDINFSGVTLTPYSDISPDGQLSVSHGLELYNGALRPSVVSGDKFHVDGTMKYIHATTQYRHVIYMGTDGKLSYIDEADYTTHGTVTAVSMLLKVDGEKDVTINSMGDILIIMRKDLPPYYCVWAGSSYNELGEIPELVGQFSLKGDFLRQKLEPFNGGWNVNPGNDNQKMTNYNLAAAAVSHFVDVQCNQNGRFVHPFFVRAAYRLYDGKTHIMHTPPVLMIPDSCGPFVSVDYQPGNIYAMGFSMKIGYKFQRIGRKWSDIIQGIDIFVSQPLDQSIYEFDVKSPDLIDQYGEGREESFSVSLCNKDLINDEILLLSSHSLTGFKYGHYLHNQPTNLAQSKRFRLRKKSGELFKPEDTANFYLLHNIKIDAKESDFENPEFTMPENYYSNLVFKDRLVDDYDSHDRKASSFSHVYNKRLSVVVDKVEHFVGHSFNTLFAFQNDRFDERVTYYIYYLTHRNGMDVWHCLGSTHEGSYLSCMNWLYTPSTAVLEVCFKKVDSDGTATYKRYSLKEHSLLNGRYFYRPFTDKYTNNFENVFGHQTTGITDWLDLDTGNPPDTEHLRNVINTSAVDNPFYFLLEGVNEVGTGRILAISTVTEPLSQGQFGSFPLMAFCTDGNYALKVLENGLYGEIKPMRRDVCLNPDSVTPIDGAIVFTSAQGVMLCDGNDINCISKDINGVADWFAHAHADEIINGGDDMLTMPTLGDALYAWDYIQQRLICFTPGVPYSFVRSNNSASWSSVSLVADAESSVDDLSDIAPVSVFNQYPYSYIQFGGGDVMIINGTYGFRPDVSHDGLIITRPMKLGTYQMKRMQAFSLQGIIGEGSSVTIELYASRDCRTWHKLGTTNRLRVPAIKGSWYKYVRFVIHTNLCESENLSALRLTYDVRQESAIR